MLKPSKPSRKTPSPNEWVLEIQRLKQELGALDKRLDESKLAIGKLTEELQAKNQELEAQRFIERQVTKLTEELRQRDLRIQRELDLAREIQERMLPVFLPDVPGIKVAIRYTPTDKVGGDLYDIMELGSGCLGILVADVSGYGLPAALVMAMSKMAFKTFAANEYSPKAVIAKVNANLCENTLEGQFLTAFFAILDSQTLRMKYVNASHCCPVLARKGGFELLDTDGLFVGMFDSASYEEKEVQLRAGDKLLFYTDGIVDAFSGNGRAFGRERLHDLIQRHAESDVETLAALIVDSLEKHTGGRKAEDDITLVGLEIEPREAEQWRLIIPSDPTELARVESAILPCLESKGYSQRCLFAVRLAVEEAVINAIRHGNQLDKAKKVTIDFSVDAEKATIVIADEGDGFDLAAVPDPTQDENLEVEHGRGIVLMRAYMDKVEYSKKGNVVTLVKFAPWLSSV